MGSVKGSPLSPVYGGVAGFLLVSGARTPLGAWRSPLFIRDNAVARANY